MIKTKKNDYLIMSGDLNARKGIIPINGIFSTLGQSTINNKDKKTF